MNALMVIAPVFSVIAMLFTVGIYDMGKHAYLISDYQKIKGTDLSIRYSTKDQCGIYRGSKYDDALVVEGNFGYDRGTTVCNVFILMNTAIPIWGWYSAMRSL